MLAAVVAGSNDGNPGGPAAHGLTVGFGILKNFHIDRLYTSGELYLKAHPLQIVESMLNLAPG